MTECKESPDGMHHYETSGMQHAVYVVNGSHTCYSCYYCGHGHCKTTSHEPPSPLFLPTEEEL